jgi:Na+/H+ antiporter NhaD/arsenite permease-like protein
MNTDLMVLVILIIATTLLEISGIWMIKQGKKTSHRLYHNIGVFECLIAPLILIVGIIGLGI